jgi:signal transduction histidine kinase
VTDKDGNFIFIDGVVQDITDRKQAEEALKASQEEARVLAGRLITTQEAERKRLARELHDDITQRLALMNIEVDKLELRHKSLSEPIKERLRQIGDNLGELSSDIQMISRQLHPSILDDLGLIQAIESECNNFTRLREIPLTLDLDNTIHNLSKETGLCIYRILQEGLRNIDRHARATDIQVQFSKKNNTVYFVLIDNGVGFDLDSSSRRRGLGLASMGERARLINGDLSLESRPGKGTVIKLEAPFVVRDKD